jgi:hypothetical protein
MIQRSQVNQAAVHQPGNHGNEFESSFFYQQSQFAAGERPRLFGPIIIQAFVAKSNQQRPSV